MSVDNRGGGRGSILESAIELFNEVGFHGASIRDIAGRSGVTAAAIYYHFASKQEILQEIMIAVLEKVIGETNKAVLEAGSDPADQLDAVVRCWVRFHVEHLPTAVIGALELRSLDDEGMRRVVDLRDRQEELFRNVVDRGVAKGRFATPYPREAARAIINMGRSIVTWYRPGGATSADELAAQYSELSLGLVRCSCAAS